MYFVKKYGANTSKATKYMFCSIKPLNTMSSIPPANSTMIVHKGPLQVQEHTLPNGLTLYMSVNKNEPRIFTNIVVRAGSKHDPAETTGLAHYMEHMLFKGTSRIGATDWEKERALLEKIAQLYETHRKTQDPEIRMELYAEIDRLSTEAAKYVAPNEYDRLSGVLGAKATNAYTWVEQTVYVNDIPSNELGRWMLLESERFRMMALRLFHTELETVYEEFNINQDRDSRKVDYAMREALFPKHPYGTQTTMGTPEHLRNPSMVNIQHFFQTYYVPNNMAIILAGDFDPQEAIELAEQYFGDYVARDIPPFHFEEQPAISGPMRKDVYGKEAPYLMLTWRLDGSSTADFFMGTMLQQLLYNQQAGLFDLFLNQQQEVLESEAWFMPHEDYSVFGLYAKPREGQDLETAEALLLRELNKLRTGDFPDWLPEAVVNDFKLGEIKAAESNESRVSWITNAFVLGLEWPVMAMRSKRLKEIQRDDIIQFATQRLRDDNFVAIYKHQGEDPGVIKVEKPPITPIVLQRDAVSAFAQHFFKLETPALTAAFVDFDTAIQHRRLAPGILLEYVHNPNNHLFRIDFIFDFGKNHDRLLALAFQYLPYLGAGKFSLQDLQIQFFRLGLHFEVRCEEERSYITLQGLEDSFEKGLELVAFILDNVQPDEEVLDNLVEDILLQRENAKSNRSFILRNAMSTYARYGNDSPFYNRLSAEELRAVTAAQLTNAIRDLKSFEHTIYYFGQQPLANVVRIVEKTHRVPATLKPAPAARSFKELDTLEDKVLFVDFPIVQTDVLLVSKGTPYFNLEEFLMRDLYNDYFGYGLSSIVFQEIREAKALAYSTYAYYGSPKRTDQAHYLQAYVGTQPDKLRDAIPAMLGILRDMPVAYSQIEQAKTAILKRIETERMLPANIYWTAQSNRDIGHPHDLRKDLYQTMQELQPADLTAFQQRYVKPRKYTFLVLGNRKDVDLGYLADFGPVEEHPLEEIFGY